MTDQRIVVGVLTCEQRELLIHESNLKPWSSLTDPDGVYGRKEIYTLWGPSGDDVSLGLGVEDRLTFDPKKCEHHVVLIDWRPEND